METRYHIVVTDPMGRSHALFASESNDPQRLSERVREIKDNYPKGTSVKVAPMGECWVHLSWGRRASVESVAVEHSVALPLHLRTRARSRAGEYNEVPRALRMRMLPHSMGYLVSPFVVSHFVTVQDMLDGNRTEERLVGKTERFPSISEYSYYYNVSLFWRNVYVEHITEPYDIGATYAKDGMGSCMSKSFSEWSVHPTSIYGNHGEVGLLAMFIDDAQFGKTMLARALYNRETKELSRVYCRSNEARYSPRIGKIEYLDFLSPIFGEFATDGDSLTCLVHPIFRQAYKSMGFEEKDGALIGCKVGKIEEDDGVVVPYLDHCLSFEDSGDCLTVSRYSGDIYGQSLCGHVRVAKCVDCDEPLDSQSSTVHNGDEVCSSCMEGYFICEGYNEWFPEDQMETVNGRHYSYSYASDNFSVCPHCNEWID